LLRSTCAHLGGHLDLHPIHARKSRDHFFALGLELLLDRTGGGGEFHPKANGSLFDLDLLDESERDDIAMEVGVLDRAEGLEYVFGCNSHSVYA